MLEHRRELETCTPLTCEFIDVGYCLKHKKYCVNVKRCDAKTEKKVLISPELTRERQRKAAAEKVELSKKAAVRVAWFEAQDLEELSKGELTKMVYDLKGKVEQLNEIVGAIVERWQE